MSHNLDRIFQEQTPLVQVLKDSNNTTKPSLIDASLPLIQSINNLMNKANSFHGINIEQNIYKEFTEFETKLWAAEYPQTTIYTSRIILCDWAKQALSLHHTKPGPMQMITNFENIQALATQIIQSINNYIEVAELISICISLGYTNPAITPAITQQIYQLVRSYKIGQPNLISPTNNLTTTKSFDYWKMIGIIPITLIIYIIYYAYIEM